MSLVEALQFDATASLPAGLCLVDDSWHQGVVGIVAARVKERFHRPVIAFAPTDSGELKGSGRSIDGVHLRDTLDAIAAKHPGLLEKFGGHAMAAGLSISRRAFEPFATAFAEEVTRALGAVAPIALVESDGELDEQDFNLDLAQELALASPWGQRFPEPMFDGVFTVISARVVGDQHLKLGLRPRGSRTDLEAIAFGAVDEPWAGAVCIHAAYRLSVNEFRGTRSLQLIIEHARAADG